MKAYPTIYHFEQVEGYYKLYLGEYSSLEGLKLLPNNIEIEKIELGVTNYKNYGFATEKEFPNFNTSGELTDFLEHEGEIGLIVFNVMFNKFEGLHTHDDGECHFRFNDKQRLIDAVNNAAPERFRTVILAKLLEQPNKYITMDENGKCQQFHTFDQYIKEGNTKTNILK